MSVSRTIGPLVLIFAQNIDCGSEAVLTSTHNLCFRAKIRKNVYPCKPQFYYIKVGYKGVFVTRTCFHDAGYSLVNWLNIFFTQKEIRCIFDDN